MNHKEAEYEDIRKWYPAYVTQAEFAHIAGICKKTAHKLTHGGAIPYREVRTGFYHHNEIRTEDVIRYLEQRKCGMDGLKVAIVAEALEAYLVNEADVLFVRDVVRISGIGDNSVARWIESGRLRAFKCKRVLRIAKSDLILYLASPYYRNAHRKPREWHEMQRYVRAYAQKLEIKTTQKNGGQPL